MSDNHECPQAGDQPNRDLCKRIQSEDEDTAMSVVGEDCHMNITDVHQEPFPFINLPLELRYEVYRHLLSTEYTKVDLPYQPPVRTHTMTVRA